MGQGLERFKEKSTRGHGASLPGLPRLRPFKMRPRPAIAPASGRPRLRRGPRGAPRSPVPRRARAGGAAGPPGSETRSWVCDVRWRLIGARPSPPLKGAARSEDVAETLRRGRCSSEGPASGSGETVLRHPGPSKGPWTANEPPDRHFPERGIGCREVRGTMGPGVGPD